MIQLAHVRGVGEISGGCSLALARVQFSIEWQKYVFFCSFHAGMEHQLK